MRTFSLVLLCSILLPGCTVGLATGGQPPDAYCKKLCLDGTGSLNIDDTHATGRIRSTTFACFGDLDEAAQAAVAEESCADLDDEPTP